jgi:hypothetical protein
MKVKKVRGGYALEVGGAEWEAEVDRQKKLTDEFDRMFPTPEAFAKAMAQVFRDPRTEKPKRRTKKRRS